MKIYLSNEGDDILTLIRRAIASDTSLNYNGVEYWLNEIGIDVYKNRMKIVLMIELGATNDETTIRVTQNNDPHH